MKIQYRILLVFSVFTVCIVLFANVLEYYFVNQNTFEDFYKRLEIRAIVAARAKFEEENLSKTAYEDIRKQHLEKLPEENEVFVTVKAEGARLVADTVMFNEEFLSTAILRGQSRYRDGDNFYLAHLYTNPSSQPENHIVVLSAKNEFIGNYLNNLKRVILITLVLTLIVSIVIGVWVTNLILKPIRAITIGMKDITANKLHLRLEAKDGSDEISDLAGTFNDMLDRLEIAFESQKNFISNASHELNTPLTTIIGESEYTLAKQREVATYQESLTAILFQAERLKSITTSLLYIAQTGFGGDVEEFVDIRIDEAVFSAKNVVDSIIPDNHVYINLDLLPEDDNQLIIKGNQQLLETAFVNVISNGCKYSDNGKVNVIIAATDKNVVVIIEDFGIGIPKEEIAQVFDPFFRASNTRGIDGYGIGLPLSRNIIRLHDGELLVFSEVNKGTKIKIILPVFSERIQ